MRWYITFLTCVFGLGAWESAHAVEEPLFGVRAKVLEAVEGGPVLIKATLSHRANKNVRFSQLAFPNTKIECPKEWRWLGKGSRKVVYGRLWGYVELAPRQTRSEMLVVHYDYAIPAGKVKLKITWSVGTLSAGSKDAQGREVPSPTTTIDVNVLPATAENVHALRERLLKRVKQLDSPDLSDSELGDMILYTKHRDLLPVAWAMIENDSPDYPFGALFRHIYEISEPDDKLYERTIRLISHNSCIKKKSHPFWYWQSHRTILPSKYLKILMGDPDLWVRVLTYDTFGEKCDRAWAQSLLAELRQVTSPLPNEQFARLLAELDDNHFQTREEASKKLIQLALRIETKLRHCDRSTLSPEASRRVRYILAEIDKQRPDSPPSYILDYIDRGIPQPQTIAILMALSEGSADSWLTKEAKARLSAKLIRRDSK